MTAPALAAAPVPDLLEAYTTHCRTLELSADGFAWRIRHARALLRFHPDLGSWMARPLQARLTDLRRTKAWPLVSWALLYGHAQADIDLLIAHRLGGLHKAAEFCTPRTSPPCAKQRSVSGGTRHGRNMLWQNRSHLRWCGANDRPGS
jgi:hypothetical protein